MTLWCTQAAVQRFETLGWEIRNGECCRSLMLIMLR